jgi:hypothetical protein
MVAAGLSHVHTSIARSDVLALTGPAAQDSAWNDVSE